MKISIIVAVAENGVIGRDNDLPWHLSADLKRFRRLTMGHHLLLGRKTFEAIGRPLPGRHMVVISRGRPELPAQVARVSSLEEGIELARQAGESEVFVAGGAQIYRLALPLADRVFLTRVHQELVGDAQFPDLDDADWTAVETERHQADENNAHDFSFVLLERR